ncbi:hypothetical protein SAY86_006707 [Trapa natans]|uniref:PORR domain-containing protein n=1 Tax=Trapa natans TaxID=22666 RepID=A0AAN7QTH9_TRANT|nr:hypothetical protein SAY86_006707 [Trapa natans]
MVMAAMHADSYLRCTCRFLKNNLFPFHFQAQKVPYHYTQRASYVDVYMKWKRDSYYEKIDHIHHSIELKRIISLKNCILKNPIGCIPISDISKRGREFEVPIRVATFLRQYPSIFEEFTGPKYSLPWFRLTQEAIETDSEEKRVYEESKPEIVERLKKLVLMSKDNVLPLNIVQGMLWYLGLPEDLLQNLERYLDGSFSIVEIGDGLKGLTVNCNEKLLSIMEKNAIQRGLCFGDVIAFPLFPSKGLRLRKKISSWLNDFQRLPYVSPYEDFSNLNPTSDIAEKRIVGLLHELLSIFVDHSAERKKLFCLKKYLGLPQKVHKAFERHPHIFYLSFQNKTCTAILKEPYNDKNTIVRHPLLRVRKKYIKLMEDSKIILKNRRANSSCTNIENKLDLDLDYVEGDADDIIKHAL